MNSINTTTSTNNTNENRIFNAIYDSIDTVIPYDVKWNNGTGYFDKAVHVSLAHGTLAKSFTAGQNNRKLILIGTMFGTIVLFERYTDGNNGVIVSNVPGEIRQMQLIPSGRIGADQILEITGVMVIDDRASLFKHNGICWKLDMMLDVFSGEFKRRNEKRLRAEEEE